jgi:hypothetical protein
VNKVTERQRWLRARIAERGIDGLLYDVAEVCDDIAEERGSTEYQPLWQERADTLRALADKADDDRSGQ